jgi:nucleoside-diphosphate-sugar epimerase
LIRLNYACDLRYGVLVDLARRIAKGEPIDVTTGYFNTIWQGDANAATLLALDHAASPPWIVNLTGPELLRVRDVATALGRRLDRPVRFVGEETDTAILSNVQQACGLFGPPRISADQLLEWVACWLKNGGELLEKPTKFDARDGRF